MSLPPLPPGWALDEIVHAADIPLVGLLRREEDLLAFWYLGEEDERICWAYTPAPSSWEGDLEKVYETLPSASGATLVLAGEVAQVAQVDPRPGDFHALQDTAADLFGIHSH